VACAAKHDRHFFNIKPDMKALNPVEVLLVEDDPDLCDILVTSLEFLGFNIRGVRDGNQLDREFAIKPANILLLDLNLPGEGGNSIAVRYRRQDPNIGIVMLTARGDLDSRVLGYADGADQYFVKPVDHQELAQALKSLGRRLLPQQSCWMLDMCQQRIVSPEGGYCGLTYNEAQILYTLAESAGSVVRRSIIYSVVNCIDDEFSSQRLETALSRLRKKIRREGLSSLPVKACHGIGYAFVEPVKVQRAA
jgi:DNA-binding response OmpR family regulator